MSSRLSILEQKNKEHASCKVEIPSMEVETTVDVGIEDKLVEKIETLSK